MLHQTVIVIAAASERDRADRFTTGIRRVYCTKAPNFVIVYDEQFDDTALDEATAAVLLVDRLRECPDYRRILRIVEAARVPVVALQDEAFTGPNHLRYLKPILIDSATDATQVAGILRGMSHRQSEVDEVRHELKVAQRYHGGLEGQIAKIHEELQLAAMIQREYLPRELPHLHGVQFAAMWRPTNYVSGDIYDIARLDEDHVGIFVADAVGHGVPAALLTMIIARSLVTKETFKSSYRIVEPGEVLARLNQQMLECQGRTTRFATAVYGIINCRDRSVRMASAGHPPPITISPDGQMQPITIDGGLLGVFDNEKYTHVEFALPAGARLMLYSDGFEQAFPQMEDGKLDRIGANQRYLDAFADLAEIPSPDAMVQHIERRLDNELGSLHQVDDLTLLCVRSGTVAERTTVEAGAKVRAA